MVGTTVVNQYLFGYIEYSCFSIIQLSPECYLNPFERGVHL